MAFPTTLPSYTITAGAETANGAAGGLGLSGLLNAFEVDITALGTKLGTGAATPAANQLLVGNGAGTSTWQALTSAQLAAIISDETGSGALVFGTAPTITNAALVTPTIASFTNAQHNHTNAAGGGSIAAGAFAQGAIAGADLSTSAICLGYTQVTSGDVTNTAPASAAQVAGMTVTVTIPAGGRRVKVTCYARYAFGTTANATVFSLWDGTVGSGTQLQTHQFGNAIGQTEPLNMVWVGTPAAGSKTYNLGVQTTSGNVTTGNASTAPMFILVEAI